MSKLSWLIAVSAATVLQGLCFPSSPQESKAREILAQLQKEESPPVPTEVAAVLFARGPRATASFVEMVGATEWTQSGQGRWAAQLEAALDGVPGVALSVLGAPDLQDGDAIRVASVSLEVLTLRGKSGALLTELEILLQVMGGKAGAVNLGASTERAISRLALAGELDGESLLRLVRASEPNLSRDVLAGAAKALLGEPIAECLGRGTGADGTILNQLHRAVRLGATVNDDLVHRNVLPFLRASVDFERSEAAHILGKVGQRAHISPLIEALGDDSRLVRLSSLAALQDLTGMTMTGNRHRWRLWYADQCTWWDTHGERLVASLGATPRRKLVAVLATVASKRLYRKEISAQLLTRLQGARPDEVCAVLAAIGSLRDPDLVPHVAELRRHSDPTVRSCAAETLRALR
jgi:hypothetical protein